MEEVARRLPEANAVVLSRRAEPGDMAQALDAGIGGYLLTDMSPAALAQAIGLVALGENVFRSGERRVGQEGDRTCRDRWPPYHKKKNPSQFYKTHIQHTYMYDSHP